MAANLTDLTEAAIEAGRSPVRWRFTSDALWRSACTLKRFHLSDVRHGRAGTSTSDTYHVRLIAVIFRRSHVAPPPTVAPVYMMLAGLALEALAKGIIVAREPHLIERGARSEKLAMTWEAPEHLSRDLLRKAGWSLTAEQATIIDRLAMFVRWAGRYPVPKNPSELGPEWGEANRGAFWTAQDFDVVEELRAALRDQLTTAISEWMLTDRAPEVKKRAAVILGLGRNRH